MSRTGAASRGDPTPRVPKVVGADAELGNLITGLLREQGTGHLASRAVLRKVDGLPGCEPDVSAAAQHRAWDVHQGGEPIVADDAGRPYNPQDVGRKFLPSTGGCVYIDLDHVELCTPEVRSAHDFVAAWHAGLRTVRDALAAANEEQPAGQRIVVLVNSSDGLGNAYGSHLNFLVTRRLFDDLFTRLHPSLFVLTAHQVSSIVYTGQGKVGAENGRPDVTYQIAQRADFMQQVMGQQTTYDRPIVNSRDEPLCGPRDPASGGHTASLARLHCIFHDSTLCHVATLLKVGVMQLVLSMLEARRLGRDLILDDPLDALVRFSHDPDLRARARLADGRRVSAVELQAMFCERVRAYVDAGECDALVPGATSIVELWEGTLELLARRDVERLAPRLDWVLKRVQIERALAARGLDWSAPQAKHLDHLYSSLDVGDGLYWALEKAGCTQAVVDEARVRELVHAPPDDTRAFTRAMLLRNIPRGRIREVDWDHIDVAPARPGGLPVRLHLPDPLGHTREHWRRDMRAARANDGGAPPRASET